jgi:hypothetical protein
MGIGCLFILNLGKKFPQRRNDAKKNWMTSHKLYYERKRKSLLSGLYQSINTESIGFT